MRPLTETGRPGPVGPGQEYRIPRSSHNSSSRNLPMSEKEYELHRLQRRLDPIFPSDGGVSPSFFVCIGVER